MPKITETRTASQKKIDEIFNYIVSFKRANDGLAPSYREIMRACNISSTSMVSFYLGKLRGEGRVISIASHKLRHISVLGGKWTYSGRS